MAGFRTVGSHPLSFGCVHLCGHVASGTHPLCISRKIRGEGKTRLRRKVHWLTDAVIEEVVTLYSFRFKMQFPGLERAQLLGALSAILEDPSSVSSNHIMAHDHSSSRGLSALF